VKNSLDVYVPLQFSIYKPTPGRVFAAEDELSLDVFMQALLNGALDDIYACFPQAFQPKTGTRTFFIQGLAGAGKSLFGWRTMQVVDEACASNVAYTGRLPVMVSLPAVKQRVLEAPVDFLVQVIFDAYPALRTSLTHQQSVEACQELFSDRRFLFFLDSVDELADDVAIGLINQLYNPGQWSHSIFVLTCRSEVLSDAVIAKALPPRESLPLGPVQESLMTSIYLLPFSTVQQEQYVSMFAEKNKDLHSGWDKSRYLFAIKEFPDLKEFLQEPLQLYLVLSVLPVLIAGKEDLANGGDQCGKHQCVKHAIHVLYQEKDLGEAKMLMEALETHPVARQKGIHVFFKATCVLETAERSDASCRHLPLAEVIIPLISAAVGDDTAHFLHEVELAVGYHSQKKAKVCPLYLSSSSLGQSEKALLSTANVSQSALQSIKALGKLQGTILKRGQEAKQAAVFVTDVMKEFAARKFYINWC